MSGVVIIGAGQAGYQVAESLRHENYPGKITLLGDESYPPYQRPPLSKQYLQGKTSEEQLKFRTEAYYQEHGIKLALDTRVTGIDRDAHEVETSTGEHLGYDKLVLATGARVRMLAVPGADTKGVCYLRTLDDVKQIQARLDNVTHAVVIGGGFIGLEFAAVAKTLGKQVAVIEAMDRLMARVVSPIVSEYYAQLHCSHGVEVICNASVTEIKHDGEKLNAVTFADGREIDADLVVVGIGVIANDDLALECGLNCNHGVVVDGQCRTSDADIFAAGDCVIYEHPFLGEPIRLESVQNATDQGKVIASVICDKEKTYDSVPWFWSDQYDKKLQMVGLSADCETQVTRGDMDGGKFSVLYFQHGKLRAIDSINKPADHIMGRKLLSANNSLTVEQAADESFPLKSAMNPT